MVCGLDVVESCSVGLGLLLIIQSSLLSTQCPLNVPMDVTLGSRSDLGDPVLELGPELLLHVLLVGGVLLLDFELVLNVLLLHGEQLVGLLAVLLISSELYLLV